MEIKIGKFEFKFGAEKSVESTPQTGSQFYNDGVTYGHIYPIVNRKWDGEKTLGELGLVVRNVPDYQRLRLRSYDAYAKIDTVKTIAEKFFNWTIGSGLKLQSEPNRNVLLTEGIKNTDDQYAAFQKDVESRFSIYANSKQCDNLKQKSLHELALDFYQGAFLGGDNLAVVRFDDNGPNIQFISGEHVCNPGLSDSFMGSQLTTDYFAQALDNGNYIEDGIEIDAKGAHIAYYVNTKPNEQGLPVYERIPAIGSKTGKRLAWIISGKKISPDHLRAVPAMSQSLEKINKLDRYTEAATAKAEQAAKIVYTIEHQEFSTGESPLDQEIARKRNPAINGAAVNPNDNNPNVLSDGLANRILETTSNQTYNMPNGASLKSFGTQIETTFAEFHSTVFNAISAGMDVPPEVAMQMYNSNYSASRAAIMSFQHIISINRTKFANDFYVPFFKLWFEHQVLNGKIKASGYIENITNFMVTESYTQCRFMGKNLPHIDPLKEVKAVREMLGPDDTSALISREQGSEILGVGEWSENYMKNKEETKLIPKEELTPLTTQQPLIVNTQPKKVKNAKQGKTNK